MFVAAACSGGGGGDQTPSSSPRAATTTSPRAATTTPTQLAATSTAAPASTATAAAPGAVTQDGYGTEPAFPQLAYDRMIEFALIPGDDGYAVVITQEGRAWRFSLTDAAEEPTLFLNIRDRIISNPGTEEGLLGIAFPPDFQETRRFYIAYSGGPPRQNILARFLAPGDSGDPASEQILIAQDDPFSNHNGGGLEFGPDGYLYMTIGDGGSAGDPLDNGQNTDTLLGKILRIDVSGDAYTSPGDNPFASGGGRPEIWAYGLRNPWRITFDRETGDLWTADVGQGAREEIDLIAPGGNYGWSIVEGDLCFKPASGCDMTGSIPPRAVYGTREDGNCAVTGGYVYRGAALPELRGWYVYGDFCSGVVWAFDTTDEAASPVRLMESGKSISSFAEDAAGELYLMTFNNEVVRLVRR
jgi:glucose/arabinose dehydrogenase